MLRFKRDVDENATTDLAGGDHRRGRPSLG